MHRSRVVQTGQRATPTETYQQAAKYSSPTSPIRGASWIEAQYIIAEVEGGQTAVDVVQALRGRGHAVDVGAGGYQAIRWDPEEGVYWGGTEMRKDGTVVGY